MAGPAFGALGATFTVTRGMQAISLIAIIGMTSNFIAELVSSNQSPPNVLIGTLSVVSFLSLHFPFSQTKQALTTQPDMHIAALRRHILHSLLRQHATLPRFRRSR